MAPNKYINKKDEALKDIDKPDAQPKKKQKKKEKTKKSPEEISAAHKDNVKKNNI